jgi:hypothetical protein
MLRNIIIAIVIIALAGGGYYYYQSSKSTKSEKKDEVTVTTVSETPEPTEEPVVKDAFKIEVLNGSGITGKAGEVQTLLEDADFIVDSTGNADNYDYEETVIEAGGNVPVAWTDELKATLEKDYKVKSSVEKKDEDSDIVTVIVGKLDDKGDDMSPEEEPTETPKAETEETSDTTPTPTISATNTPTPTP